MLPSFTFIATGEALAQLGYRLRFCDVDPGTWTLDPEQLERALEPGDVRVAVAVDALGAPADYQALNTVCRRFGVPLVGDSAPSLGSTTQGAPVGTQADAHAFSMSFAKTVSAAGGGGVAVVPLSAVDRLREPIDWTRSAMMGEVHAATALELVLRLPQLVHDREKVARAYNELEALTPSVVPQRVAPGDGHSWVHWVARFADVDRDLFVKELEGLGVLTKPYYSPALHLHPWQGVAEAASSLPVTDQLARETLALPMSSELSASDAENVFWRVVTAMETVR